MEAGNEELRRQTTINLAMPDIKLGICDDFEEHAAPGDLEKETEGKTPGKMPKMSKKAQVMQKIEDHDDIESKMISEIQGTEESMMPKTDTDL